MNKKSLIFLIVAIIFFIIAVGIFFYAKSLGNSDSQNENTIEESNTESKTEEFIFYDENNNKFNMNNFNGTPIALILWSSDTENSFEIIEMIESLYNDYKDMVTFLVINTDEPSDDIIQTVKSCGYSFPVYYDLDNSASNYYSYLKLPTLIFIEANGNISNQIESDITEDSLLANLDLIAENY